jgi:hypothetical protein
MLLMLLQPATGGSRSAFSAVGPLRSCRQWTAFNASPSIADKCLSTDDRPLRGARNMNNLELSVGGVSDAMMKILRLLFIHIGVPQGRSEWCRAVASWGGALAEGTKRKKRELVW